MKTRYTIALSLLAGTVLGAAAIQGLHAQAKPKAYVVIEIDVTNQDAFAKEYIPIVGKIITDNGGKYLSRGGKITAIEGTAPKRLTILEFENTEKAQAAFASPAYREARKTGEKYAKFRVIAAEATTP